MNKMSSWGRLSEYPHQVMDLSAARTSITNTKSALAFGMGRSYGDVCLNPHNILYKTTNLDRYMAFDEENGLLTCEAGVLLRDIQRLMLPRGFILPVTPGTQLVTVGGAIANDVHGKNHHVQGSFGHHITRLTLLRTDGSVIECGPDLLSDWFAATVGGLGLTGFILHAQIKLARVKSPWLATETIPYDNLDSFFTLADDSEKDYEHTVSWLDCLHKKNTRGIFMRANFIAEAHHKKIPSDHKKKMPFTPPISLVNQLTLKPFNVLYFYLNKWRAGKNISHYEPFFYPLDNILEWNLMYGPKGFYQYQSVVPRDVSHDAIKAMLNEISSAGIGSFLSVLKTFGGIESLGMLSFPIKHGVTLALDFPNQQQKTLKLFARLDAIIREAGGRIYPAKDARMPRDLFEQSYVNLNTFLNYRDPGISSLLSRRLMGS